MINFILPAGFNHTVIHVNGVGGDISNQAVTVVSGDITVTQLSPSDFDIVKNTEGDAVLTVTSQNVVGTVFSDDVTITKVADVIPATGQVITFDDASAV